MHFFLSHILEILFGALAVQIGISIFLLISNRRGLREARRIERELFGLTKKIEGLTATNRERVERHYDEILIKLEQTLPALVAKDAGDAIFKAESQILKRLAELEPNLREDEEGMKRFDDLIVTMEKLEETVVSTASNAVLSAVGEGREALKKLDPDLRQ